MDRLQTMKGKFLASSQSGKSLILLTAGRMGDVYPAKLIKLFDNRTQSNDWVQLGLEIKPNRTKKFV